MNDFKTALKGMDVRPFLSRSDYKAWHLLLVNYGLIAVAFALPAIWMNPITLIAAVVLLGNRQLGLGILMHDCAHNALFKTKRLNQAVGEILCAAPMLAQFEGYRKYHLRHHAKAGSTDDPDYPNYKSYPVSKPSFYRKLARDMFGVTGVRNLGLLMLMHAGVVEYDMAYKNSEKRKLHVLEVCKQLFVHLRYALAFHLALFVVLFSLGVGALYGLWWVAYFTTFMLFSRIRNAAEHAGVPDLLDPDPRLHARTVYASIPARLTVAPNHVNYHLEHHWMPGIPPYHLADFHRALLERGILRDTKVLAGYTDVLRCLVTRY